MVWKCYLPFQIRLKYMANPFSVLILIILFILFLRILLDIPARRPLVAVLNILEWMLVNDIN